MKEIPAVSYEAAGAFVKTEKFPRNAVSDFLSVRLYVSQSDFFVFWSTVKITITNKRIEIVLDLPRNRP